MDFEKVSRWVLIIILTATMVSQSIDYFSEAEPDAWHYFQDEETKLVEAGAGSEENIQPMSCEQSKGTLAVGLITAFCFASFFGYTCATALILFQDGKLAYAEFVLVVVGTVDMLIVLARYLMYISAVYRQECGCEKTGTQQ